MSAWAPVPNTTIFSTRALSSTSAEDGIAVRNGVKYSALMMVEGCLPSLCSTSRTPRGRIEILGVVADAGTLNVNTLTDEHPSYTEGMTSIDDPSTFWRNCRSGWTT